MALTFVPLSRLHDRIGFDSGEESINRYLRQTARQHADKDLALTIVLAESADSARIIGFYTLLMGTVACAVIPAKGLPSHQSAPVVLLAQLGVDVRYQSRGHGTDLLYDALQQALRASEHVGCLGVVLNALNDRARDFYVARGFQVLADDPRHLWIPMSAIRQLFSAE